MKSREGLIPYSVDKYQPIYALRKAFTTRWSGSRQNSGDWPQDLSPACKNCVNYVARNCFGALRVSDVSGATNQKQQQRPSRRRSFRTRLAGVLGSAVSVLAGAGRLISGRAFHPIPSREETRAAVGLAESHLAHVRPAIDHLAGLGRVGSGGVAVAPAVPAQRAARSAACAPDGHRSIVSGACRDRGVADAIDYGWRRGAARAAADRAAGLFVDARSAVLRFVLLPGAGHQQRARLLPAVS